MGRAPCCDKANVRKGPWSPQEDSKLKGYIERYGTGGNWIALPQKIGLKRCGKSCRLRWLNYLRPNIKHGRFSEEEDDIICSLYMNIGSRWSIIAAQLPGRSDNDIKNYWNTRLKKKVLFGNPKLDHQTRPLAATKRERDDVQSYATSDLDIRSPNIYQPRQAQHMNMIYGPGTITESKSSSEQATSQLKTQQIQLYQKSFEQSSCLGELLQKPEGFVIDFRSNNNMTMISTSSTIQASTDCINAATQIQQSAATYHSNSDSTGEVFYQTSATPILFYPGHMENYIKLENSYAAFVENDNSLFFSPPISEGGIYESEWMNTFNLENNHLGDCGGSPELNDLILLYNDGSEVQQKEPCNYDYESINLF